MAKDVRKSEKGGNALYLNLGIWYDKDSDQIHMTLPRSDWFHTTVNRKPGSKRCHENLFKKLGRCLKAEGVPFPQFDEDD